MSDHFKTTIIVEWPNIVFTYIIMPDKKVAGLGFANGNRHYSINHFFAEKRIDYVTLCLDEIILKLIKIIILHGIYQTNLILYNSKIINLLYN